MDASRAVQPLPGVRQLAFPLRRLARRRHAGLVDVTLWGHRLRLASTGNLSDGRLLFLPDRWDRAERAFLARHLRPGAVVIDVGANAGGYVWWVRSLLGSRCRIVAVEPDPELNARLRFNLATNGDGDALVFDVAVGPRRGEVHLRIDPSNRGENAIAAPPRGEEARAASADGARMHAVRALPLPELLERARVTRVDALKIDIEGLEGPVLLDFFQRAERGLWPALLLTERKDTPAHDAMEAALVDLGYGVERRTRRNLAMRL